MIDIRNKAKMSFYRGNIHKYAEDMEFLGFEQ
jgi:hypothetical protein